jgi:TRAP-type uncharacterized transport system substrate-binding protein
MFRLWALILALIVIAHSGAVLAQTAAAKRPASQNRTIPLPADGLLLGQSKNEANAGTVTIMTQRVLNGPLMTAALDLSTLLDEGERFEKMRVLPVIARGKMQNLWDMIYLGGIDLAFLQTDTLEYLKDDPQIAAIKRKVRYITVMFSEEISIVARSEINSLQDLAGKKVSINAKGTAAAVTAPLIFKRLGIPAILEHEESNIAIERMRAGDLAAHVFLLAKPARPVAQLKGDGLRILPIPFTSDFEQLYLPSKLASADYPNLIRAGQEVETIAVGNILAVFNWPEGSERYKKVARFVEVFFSRFYELHKPGFSPKWRDVNITAQVPGWTRFKPAQDWLDKKAELEKGTAEKFNVYARERRAAHDSASESELFRQFLEWRGTRHLPPQPAEPAIVERTPVALVPPAKPVQKPKIRLLAAGRAPLAEQSLPDGGLITALVSSSLGKAGQGDASSSEIDVLWAKSAQAPIQSLLNDRSIDISLPWEKADCERPNDLDQASAVLCDNAFYSDPILQVVIGLFTLSDSTFKFDTDESVFGRTICVPEDRDVTALNDNGRNWLSEKRITALRKPTLVDCISAVQKGEADAFIANDLEARYSIGKLGLAPLFRMAERPLGMRGVHAIVSKEHARASELIDAVNRGLKQLKQSDAYATILRQHLMRLWDARARTP